MTTSKIKGHLLGWVCLGAVFSLQPVTVQAYPGPLAQYPLFTAGGSGSNTPPNIFFQLDDSGSMAWDYLTKQYWLKCKYDPNVSACSSSNSTLQNDGNNTGDWRDDTPDMNILAYNPNVTYVAWKAGDTSYYGATTANPNADAALGVNGVPTSITFEVWNDTHGYTGDATHGDTTGAAPSQTGTGTASVKKVGTVTTTTVIPFMNREMGANGVVDYWDEHTQYVISNSTTTPITQNQIKYGPTSTVTCTSTTAFTVTNPNVTAANYATVAGCKTNNVVVKIKAAYALKVYTASTSNISTGLYSPDLGRLRTIAEEQQNIANWYAYYRTRVNVAKGAIGQVVDANPKYRYGLNTIWNRVFIEVPSQYNPATSTTTRTDFVTPNTALLASLYAQSPSDGTPLPNALDRVGKYFSNASIPKAAANTSGLSTSTMLTASTSSTSTTYTKPIIYECQQNFAIMFTDGYWNETLSNAAITDADGDGVSKTLADVARYYYKNDLSPDTNDNGNAASNPANTPKGTGWIDKVPTNDFDTANWQHMVTFTVAFGLQGNLVSGSDGWPNPALTESGDRKDTTAIEQGLWGTAVSGGLNDNIDDLWHAAYNAKGLYVSASSPEAVSEGFKQILDNISKRDYQGSAAAVSFSSATSASTSSVYVGQFAKPISATWAGEVLSVSSDPTKAWSASTKMVSQTTTTGCTVSATIPCAIGRKIFTSNTTGTQGAPFQWANLTDTQLADLGTGSNGVINAGTATAPNAVAFARLAYLRGDTSQEIGKTGATYNFRSRTQTKQDGTKYTNLIGDIIHSDPVFVGKPTSNWPNAAPFPTGTVTTTGSDTSSYDNFKQYQTKTPRLGIVYAGANDGMLHGFYASGTAIGTEAMAYIPNTLFSSGSATAGLHYLTDTAYTHRYYVDMPSVVNDVFLNGKWRTILIGGEMAGGRGIFALDITDPTLFATENTTNAAKIALWEFDNSNDTDMGYSHAIPSIVMTNAKNSAGNNRWGVIFGNGYNNTGSGQAALFVIFLDANLVDGTWNATGSYPDYVKIKVPVSTDPTTAQVTAGIDCDVLTTCNGLSIPQGYSLYDNKVTDRVYAGDIKGNMWAFDLSNANPANWKVAYGTASSPQPLFTATYYKTVTGSTTPQQQTTTPQPITSRPVIVKNASVNTSGINLLVLFGTGQYLVSTDPDSTAQQTMYGVWDHGFTQMTPANLVEQTFAAGPFYDNVTGANITSSVRVLSNNPVRYTQTTAVTGSNQGWFINLPAAKERLVVDPDAVQDQYLFFNTWVPGDTTTVSNGCSTGGSAGGTGYLMNVNLFTGTATSAPIVDVNSDGVVNNNDLVKNTATTASGTIMSVVGGVLYNQGLPSSSTFLNQKQYTSGASYSATADQAASAAAAAAKIISDASAAASVAAAQTAATAKAAYDAAVAANASASTLASLKATWDSAAAAATAAANQAAVDLAAYNAAAAAAAQAAAASSKQINVAAPVSRIIGGWRQCLNAQCTNI